MCIKQDHYQFGLSILTGLLLTSSGAVAGDISTTFSPGGVITATQMTEIKDAVNDNDSVIARLFGGDGSAGDLIVSASLDWEATPPSNPYFNNITIDAGQILSVPAGTTIRCRGSFINNGILSVATNRNGGSHTSSSSNPEAISAPHPGDSIRAAGSPASTSNFAADAPFLAGGRGGSGIPETKTLTSYNHFRYGGGGGSGHRRQGTDGNGGDGGGLVKIQCSGTITNNGLIDADASASVGGGGGGGIVVLASLTDIINAVTATITANGGDGEASGTDHGNAGGGGGGIIVTIAPSISDFTGITSVDGGSAGSVPTTIFSNVPTSGGGGGGGSGGDGGVGGSLSPGGTPSGSPGSAGHVIQIVAIPLPY